MVAVYGIACFTLKSSMIKKSSKINIAAGNFTCFTKRIDPGGNEADSRLNKIADTGKSSNFD